MNTTISLSLLTLIILGITIWLISKTLREGYSALDDMKKNK